MTRRKPLELLVDCSLHIAILLLAAFCAVRFPQFITHAPLDLIKNVATYACMALGMGLIMRAGEIDLSAGQALGALAALIYMPLKNSFYQFLDLKMPNPILIIILAFIAVVIFGGLIGLANGALVTRLRIPSPFSTLAMWLILYGAAFLLAHAPYSDTLRSSGTTPFLPEMRTFISHSVTIGSWNIPNFVWYAAAIIVAVWFVWNRTSVGRNIQAAGDNRAAAESTGVNVKRTVTMAFVIAGILFGISAFIIVSKFGTSVSIIGRYAEFDAITACLIGGMSLKYGKGRVSGILIGLAFYQLVNVCLQWLSVTEYAGYIIKGVLIIIAAALSINRDLRKARKAENEAETAQTI